MKLIFSQVLRNQQPAKAMQLNHRKIYDDGVDDEAVAVDDENKQEAERKARTGRCRECC